jgi:hypothetical protein
MKPNAFTRDIVGLRKELLSPTYDTDVTAASSPRACVAPPFLRKGVKDEMVSERRNGVRDIFHCGMRQSLVMRHARKSGLALIERKCP